MSKVQKLMRGLLLLFLCLWLSATASVLHAQAVTVSGSDQLGLPGVEVWSGDYQFSGTTDNIGSIDITSWDQQGILNFRFLGFKVAQLSASQIQEQAYQVILVPETYDAGEVVIYGRQAYDVSDVPAQIVTITQHSIESTNPQTAADALSQHGDVFVQKSQLGGGSPVIRGFEANRVLLVIDGVRMNNAIFRNGHLQNAITIDPAILDKLDVIFGPNSLIYGSDALGGVVHFQTRHPDFGTPTKNQLKTNYYARYNSSNQEYSGHIDFNYGSKTFASLTSVTYSDFGDLRTGNNRPDDFPNFGERLLFQSRDENLGIDLAAENDNPNVQIGTAYSQLDLLQKMSWIINDDSDIDLNIQYSTSSDVPRYDNLSEIRNGTLRWAEWSFGPQNRFLSSITYNNFKPTSFYDRLKVIGAYQRIDEDRITRLWQIPIRETQNEDVSVGSFTIDLSKDILADQLTIDYGIDVQHNEVTSAAFGEDINTSVLSQDVLTRYGSGENRLTNSGAYVYLRSDQEQIDWALGLRYSRSNYFISYNEDDPVEWPTELIEGVQSSNDAITFSASTQIKLDDLITANAVVSSAFRSPNIDDLSRIRVNGDEISFPNLNLQPERSLNFELGVSGAIGSKLSFNTYGYLTRLSDAIVRDDFTTPDGSSTYINRGDTLRVIANQNIAEAFIVGFSHSMTYDVNERFSLDGSINWIRGNEIIDGTENEPFSHIPPTYGQVTAKYNQGVLEGSLVYRFNGFKPIERFGGTVDNPEFATPIGSLAWRTLNAYSTYKFSDRLSLTAGVENIFDLHYRTFSSGLSAPGRSITLALRGSF